jgi:hypothetical protein
MWRRRQHREVAMIWLTEEMRYGDGGLLFGVVLARSHPSSTLYFGIVILCTLINKAWFTYRGASLFNQLNHIIIIKIQLLKLINSSTVCSANRQDETSSPQAVLCRVSHITGPHHVIDKQHQTPLVNHYHLGNQTPPRKLGPSLLH